MATKNPKQQAVEALKQQITRGGVSQLGGQRVTVVTYASNRSRAFNKVFAMYPGARDFVVKAVRGTKVPGAGRQYRVTCTL